MSEYIILFCGCFHWLLLGYALIYPLIFKNYLFDNIYIFMCVILIISWIVFKNECCISLIAKKLLNKNYKAGDDVSNFVDMEKFSPFLFKYFIQAYPLIIIYIIGLIYMVSRRNRILDTKLLILLLCILFIYILYTKKFCNEKLYDELKIDDYVPYVKFVFLIILLYILFKISSNIYKIK